MYGDRGFSLRWQSLLLHAVQCDVLESGVAVPARHCGAVGVVHAGVFQVRVVGVLGGGVQRAARVGVGGCLVCDQVLVVGDRDGGDRSSGS